MNAAMQIAQRSNASAVKTTIRELLSASTELPLHQVAMLSQWASVDDAYYKVIIVKYNGIPALLRAMKHFPESGDLQAYACTALSHLNNKLQIHQQGGVHAMITALQDHPNNITVVSAALQALKSQSLVLKQEPNELLQELTPLLEHSKDMYLTPAGKEAALCLCQFLSALQQQQQQQQPQTTTTETNHTMDIDITTSR